MIERYRVDEGRVGEAARQPQYASAVHGVPAASAAEDEGRQRTGWYWVRWTLAMVVMGAVIGGGLVAALRFVNGPVQAGATIDPIEAARASVAPKPYTNILAGEDIQLTYPAAFDQVGNVKKVPEAFDQYYLTSKASPARAISVAVLKLASGRLEEDSSYKYRSMHPELYTSTTMKFGSETAVLMTKTDKTEATLFWPHKGKDLNLAITSTDPHDSVSDFMRAIVPTLRWRQ